MARKDKQRPGYGKLLDVWAPPEKTLQPVGCLATTFTFAPPFFEEECLARFLQLETDPVQDGVYHLVEREEKLSQVTCAAVLVDQHHCRGARSLRWDMLPARLPRGILHAKISLLCWTGWTRLVVASANLTEDGYRRNREVFAVLDFHANSETPLACLTETVTFLREAATYAEPDGASRSPAVQRWHDLLDHAETTAPASTTGRRATRTTVSPVLVGPKHPDAFTQLRALWPNGTPPDEAWVVSPFFDPPEAPNRPAERLWDMLRKRGKCTVNYCVAAEAGDGEEPIAVQAPQSLRDAQPRSGRALETRFHAVEPAKDDADEATPALRPLHAKCLWLEGEGAALYMVGSSNFTSAGLGLNQVNLEANLAFAADQARDPETRRVLDEAFPPYNTLAGELRFQSADATSVDEPGMEECLPSAFGAATYDSDDTGLGTLRLTLTAIPPTGWEIAREDSVPLLTESQWRQDEQPLEVTLVWPLPRPPSGLWVRWTGAKAAAWWPVNIVSSHSLPPPEELRELPLDVLLTVLTSARPLHRVLRERLNGSSLFPSDAPGIIDPLKKVETSQFLLQRSRRVSWALCSLRERLEKPVPNEHCLQWRLHGPVGVMAVAKALEREAHSEDEAAFLLSELALEVYRVRPAEGIGCLPPSKVRAALKGLMAELKVMVPNAVNGGDTDMAKYVGMVWAEASK